MAEVVEPPAPAVEAPPVAEVVSEEITAPPVEEITPPAPAVEEAPPPDVAFVPEVAPPVEDIVTPPPAVEPVPSTAQVEAPTLAEPPTAEPDSLAAERAYLKKHPRDYDAWIKLARELWQADKHAESLEAYGRLIRAGKLLEHVIPDLESYLERWPGVDVQTALGDAYMKDGRLQEALDLYRRALGTF